MSWNTVWSALVNRAFIVFSAMAYEVYDELHAWANS